jgi:hypothetical protein
MLPVMAKKKNPAAVALGRKGGKANKGKTGIVKGFAAMSPEDRRAIQEKGWAARRKKSSGSENKS